MTTAETTEPLDPAPAPPDSAADTDDAPAPLGRASLLDRYGLLALLGAVVVLFSLLPASRDTFPTDANLTNLLGNQTVVTVTALALLLPLLAGHFDISLPSTAGLSALGTAAAMSRFSLPLPVAVVIGIGIGLAVGALIGALVCYGSLSSVTVSLAATIGISGLVQWYTDGVAINTGISPELRDFGSDRIWIVPLPALVLLAAATALWYLLEHTPFGRYLHMIGENPQAGRLVGLSVQRLGFAAFVIAGALAGIAGVVLCARSGGANPQDGPGYLFPALAAVFLGTTAIKPGRFSVGGTVIGVFFVATAVSGLSLAGVRPWVQPVFNGCALLAALILSRLTSARRQTASGSRPT